MLTSSHSYLSTYRQGQAGKTLIAPSLRVKASCYTHAYPERVSMLMVEDAVIGRIWIHALMLQVH